MRVRCDWNSPTLPTQNICACPMTLPKAEVGMILVLAPLNLLGLCCSVWEEDTLTSDGQVQMKSPWDFASVWVRARGALRWSRLF